MMEKSTLIYAFTQFINVLKSFVSFDQLGTTKRHCILVNKCGGDLTNSEPLQGFREEKASSQIISLNPL